MPDDDGKLTIELSSERARALRAALKEYEYWRDEVGTDMAWVSGNEFRDGVRYGAMGAAANIVCAITTGMEPHRTNKTNQRKPNEKDNSED